MAMLCGCVRLDFKVIFIVLSAVFLWWMHRSERVVENTLRMSVDMKGVSMWLKNG